MGTAAARERMKLEQRAASTMDVDNCTAWCNLAVHPDTPTAAAPATAVGLGGSLDEPAAGTATAAVAGLLPTLTGLVAEKAVQPPPPPQQPQQLLRLQQLLLNGNLPQWMAAVAQHINEEGDDPKELLHILEQLAAIKVIGHSIDVERALNRLRSSCTYALPGHLHLKKESAAAIPSGARRQEQFIHQQQAGHGCLKVLVLGPKVAQGCKEVSQAEDAAVAAVSSKLAARSAALLSWRLQHLQGLPLGWLAAMPAWRSMIAGQVSNVAAQLGTPSQQMACSNMRMQLDVLDVCKAPCSRLLPSLSGPADL